MTHQTIHPTRVPPRVLRRFASWADPILQDLILRIQDLHPDLDIVGSFAQAGESSLATLTLKAMTARIGATLQGPGCSEPFSYEAEATYAHEGQRRYVEVEAHGVSLRVAGGTTAPGKSGPAYMPKKGRRYRVTIEELPE